jgi:hypothetical protein
LNATATDVQQGIKGKDLVGDDDENKVKKTRAVPSLAESPFRTT